MITAGRLSVKESEEPGTISTGWMEKIKIWLNGLTHLLQALDWHELWHVVAPWSEQVDVEWLEEGLGLPCRAAPARNAWQPSELASAALGFSKLPHRLSVLSVLRMLLTMRKSNQWAAYIGS